MSRIHLGNLSTWTYFHIGWRPRYTYIHTSSIQVVFRQFSASIQPVLRFYLCGIRVELNCSCVTFFPWFLISLVSAEESLHCVTCGTMMILAVSNKGTTIYYYVCIQSKFQFTLRILSHTVCFLWQIGYSGSIQTGVFRQCSGSKQEMSRQYSGKIQAVCRQWSRSLQEVFWQYSKYYKHPSNFHFLQFPHPHASNRPLNLYV